MVVVVVVGAKDKPPKKFAAVVVVVVVVVATPNSSARVPLLVQQSAQSRSQVSCRDRRGLLLQLLLWLPLLQCAWQVPNGTDTVKHRQTGERQAGWQAEDSKVQCKKRLTAAAALKARENTTITAAADTSAADAQEKRGRRREEGKTTGRQAAAKQDWKIEQKRGIPTTTSHCRG